MFARVLFWGVEFMRASSAALRIAATEIVRREVRDTEESFGSIITDIARLLWPKGTAVEIAALVGCSVRNAELYLSGSQKWSGDALAIIVAEILKRHAMRNVKVAARK